MKILTVGFLTINSPLSSPRGQTPMGFMSQTSPTSSPISSPGKRVLRSSASFNGRTITASCATEEKRDIAFRRKKDHYSLLGVPRDVSYSDIRVAYRKLALQYHPDVMPLHQLETATQLFSETNKAYETLSDPEKRKAYDTHISYAILTLAGLQHLHPLPHLGLGEEGIGKQISAGVDGEL